LLLSLLVLANGCDGCGSKARWTWWGARTNGRLLIGDTCSFDTKCKKTCPQGDVCMFYQGYPRDRGVCECRSVWHNPCATASDWGPRPPGETCLWNGAHYPESDIGSCECAADCQSALDCKPIAGCPEGPVCAPIPWGDGRRCVCASKVPDGGEL